MNSSVAQEVVARINAHDVEGIVALMAADYVFVDSSGTRSFRPQVEAGWKQYLAVVPDYWIRIDHVVPDGSAVVLFGYAGGTYAPNDELVKPENKWETPAVWRAVIRDGKVSEWRIYCDNEPIRARMRTHIS